VSLFLAWEQRTDDRKRWKIKTKRKSSTERLVQGSLRNDEFVKLSWCFNSVQIDSSWGGVPLRFHVRSATESRKAAPGGARRHTPKQSKAKRTQVNKGRARTAADHKIHCYTPKRPFTEIPSRTKQTDVPFTSALQSTVKPQQPDSNRHNVGECALAETVTLWLTLHRKAVKLTEPSVGKAVTDYGNGYFPLYVNRLLFKLLSNGVLIFCTLFCTPSHHGRYSFIRARNEVPICIRPVRFFLYIYGNYCEV